jgi:hypothetical protein
MKKVVGIALKIMAGLIVFVLVLAFTVPIIFKDKIKTKVEQVINESVNAKVKFEDYKLSIFKNFPNLAFSLKDVSVVGVDKFRGDTLAGFRSFDLVFNLGSIFSKSGYEVKSITVDRGVVNAIYAKDGSANWDIMKDTASAPAEAAAASSSSFRMKLKKFTIQNSSISYIDREADMAAYLNNLNANISGDMTASTTDLKIDGTVGALTFVMEGTKYLNKTVVVADMNLLADLDKYKFTFRENYVSLNDLKLNFTGMVAMPGDDIETDLTFGADKASFKSLLSLVPAIYMADYKDLSASGEFSLKGSARGVYSDAKGTMPDVTLSVDVSNGLISYPALPEKIRNIAMKMNLFMDGKVMDNTTVNIDKFHMELAGNPFDMTFSLKTPMSDPDFTGSLTGKIDLGALTKAVPLDSITLAGIIEMSVKMAGKYSMVEKGQYDKFQASGQVSVKDMLVDMTGYPKVGINSGTLAFSPQFATITNVNMKVGGKSDFSLAGKLENYIQYALKDETIKGSMSLNSSMIDASDILAGMSSDTTAVEDTTSLSVIAVPKNIDFDFNAVVRNFSYDNIKATDMKGHIIVKNGILSFRETGMNILGGYVGMNADYDTRDTLKPLMKADFVVKGMEIKDAFNTFNTVQKLAPAAKGVDGKINLSLAFQSLLAKDMMPVTKTIEGAGKFQSDEITLVESAAFNKMKDVLKLGDKYSNTFKNINVSFKISNGRVYVSPFDAKVGNVKMNVSGDQGLDQTLNYLVKTEIPRADLGGSVNSLIDNLSSQAASLGFAFKPADVLKVNVRITGVFGKPVVMPDFGGTSGNGGGGVKETAKETVKQTVANTVDKGKDELRKQAEEQGDKLIKEAEMRGQQLRDQADSASVKLINEAAVQGKKLVDGAKGAIAKMAAQKGADALKKEADKKAITLKSEAEKQSVKLVDDAKAQKQSMIDKIK